MQFQTLKKDVLTSDIEKEKQLAALNKPKGIIQRKMERIFGAVGNVQMMFLQGFKMGAIVGGIFGGLMGSYYAIMYRQFMYIPMSALGSGASFGFFMGIGMIMRSEMEGVEDQLALKEGESYNSEYTVVSFNPQNGQVTRTPIYKTALPYNM